MHPIQPYLRTEYSSADVRVVTDFLEAAGTFCFPTLATGLFSASVSTCSEYEYTGYHHAWVRDNMHIAQMFHVLGQHEVAAQAVRAVTRFFHSQSPKLAAITTGAVKLRDLASTAEAMHRPHVRFRGDDLTESPEKWAHAQNDALGYWMWMYCRLAADGHVGPSPEDLRLLAAFIKYFETIRFWEDEDSGHWEETRKIEASSIGVVAAALQALRRMLHDRPDWAAEFRYDGSAVPLALVDRLILEGRQALDDILPFECRQPKAAQRRRYDAALLFLIYPIDIGSGPMAEWIVRDVVEHLQGPHGIRRYVGDPYWCQNYKELVAKERRTTDVSDEPQARDQLLEPGCEAQWCLFDPILSIIHGREYERTRSLDSLRAQTHYLNRSLRQLTGDDTPPFPPLRCPESYYCEAGRYVPNDITPLLWTQANLRLALHFMARSAEAET